MYQVDIATTDVLHDLNHYLAIAEAVDNGLAQGQTKTINTNVDDIKHELALNEMGERVFTRKIEASDTDGNLITEVKGAIREVEVGPGQIVEWFIVPVQTTDEAVEITCEIPGHYEAGMHASVEIN